MGIVFVILAVTPTITWCFVMDLVVGTDKNPARREGPTIPILNLRRQGSKAFHTAGGQELGVKWKKGGAGLLNKPAFPDFTPQGPQVQMELTHRKEQRDPWPLASVLCRAEATSSGEKLF